MMPKANANKTGSSTNMRQGPCTGLKRLTSLRSAVEVGPDMKTSYKKITLGIPSSDLCCLRRVLPS